MGHGLTPEQVRDIMEEPSGKKAKEHHRLLVRVRQRCKELGISEPIDYLTEVMAGHDPRVQTSELYEAVKDIGDLAPTQDQWDHLRDVVMMNPAYHVEPVEAETSIKAAEKIMEFVHPKLKAVDVQAKVAAAHVVVPLTKEEITDFDSWFNSEF